MNQIPSESARDSFSGDVICRRSQSAGHYDEINSAEQFANGIGHIFDVIAENSLFLH